LVDPVQTKAMLVCPICNDSGRQVAIISPFAWTGHGHAWCRACGGSYDDNTASIQKVFASGNVDAASITDEAEYRKLFVETSNITGEGGTVYPRFQWDNNAEMQAAIATQSADAIRKNLNTETPRVLDLGCGNGFTTRGLGRLFGNDAVVGVDPSPTILQLRAEPAIECYQGTLDKIGFPDASFDAVAIIGNLMLHPNPPQTMAEVARILKPGGVVVFDVKNIRSLTRLAALWLASVSPRLARHRLIQRNFVNMRFGLHRGHFGWLCQDDQYVLLETVTKPPRLLAFSNRSEFTGGLKGLVWGLADRLDLWRDEQSWLQFTARRK
jgi:SAM-dependent methyltransferase